MTNTTNTGTESPVSIPLIGLSLLRAPFPPNQISRLPKPTKAQTDEVKANFKAGIRCAECGLWHHPNVVHLDYVGHAALTDRLLDADPSWNWEPVEMTPTGPTLDQDGGMWIRLTVCGVTRLGYGDAQDKTGPNATKERIGDALRNAAMRFGAALDLWHKGELHIEAESAPEAATEAAKPPKPLSVAAQAFATLPPERQQELRDMAMDVLSSDGDEALYLNYEIAKKKLDADEQVAFWSLFDSKQRSAIKREGENYHKAVAIANAEKMGGAV